jgi:menaquinone-dependent protoporphyrinogen oxidase
MSRLLIAYASRHGTTREIAEAIAGTLRISDMDVDVKAAGEAVHPAEYDAVVIGTPLYAGRTLKEAVTFAKRHTGALKTRPVAVFVVGMSFKHPSDAKTRKALDAITSIRENADVKAMGMFAGRMNPAFAPLVGRFMRYNEAKTDDARDWDAISAWATALPAKLGIEPGTAE